VINKALAKLHDEIKTLSPAEYLAAVTFIDSLAFEARFQPSPPLAPVAASYAQPSGQAPTANTPPRAPSPPAAQPRPSAANQTAPQAR
jgi:hypothetical protein